MSVLIDGPDFAGKSTICPRVRAELAERGYPTRHSIGSLTSLADWLYRRFPGSHTRLSARTFILVLLRDLLFLTNPLLDAVVRPFLVRRTAVLLQEGYYDRVWCHHLVRGHRAAAAVAGRLRRLVRFDLRIYLDVTYEESLGRYLGSGRMTESDEIRFGSGAERHRVTISRFRGLAREIGYVCVAAGTLKEDELTDLLVAHIVELIEP